MKIDKLNGRVIIDRDIRIGIARALFFDFSRWYIKTYGKDVEETVLNIRKLFFLWLDTNVQDEPNKGKEVL
jgi:hypothetical protein